MTNEETKRRFQAWCQREIGNNCLKEDYAMFNNIMALLEQQPSDDCVSREQAIKTIGTDIQLNLEGRSGLLKYSDEIKDILKALLDSQEKKLKALPPVTPTHGTCEDCKHWDKDNEYCKHLSTENGWSEDEYYQVCTDKDFYCREFERRGDENEKKS